ncbi:DEAD/DEAH box helicase [Cellvibrio zantedeschiae]|uniref:DEAD/DEAH box helicase n=1 Tax=Cellvibrio zantedeschiae TaxID=1237077 RepID=A0ABQ3B4N9_9GAMM|nr:DEAD/DEAH box helicase family protein [Cellvibrio zantedeschiae]GGY79515.1 DEAD/DEAH box helicase [Cellvibrio zantedeschiae]
MQIENIEVDDELNHELNPTETANVIPLADFIQDFGRDLMAAVERDNPPVYSGMPDPKRMEVLQTLIRKPFEAQANAVQALSALLFDQHEKAAVLNAEMGTGKTMMAICLAAVARHEGYKHTVVISPPHLVYKWRREIQETIPGARVWVLNGPDTLAKLIKLRQVLRIEPDKTPEFFIIGRVRMRMGYHWRHAFTLRKFRRLVNEDLVDDRSRRFALATEHPACPACGEWILNDDGELTSAIAIQSQARQTGCKACGSPLWTLMRPKSAPVSLEELVRKALCQLPTIGPKTADRLIGAFGAKLLESMLADNIYEFVNLMDGDGELVFTDRQASRLERALATAEFGFGQGGYQPTEFFKRYIPKGFVDLLIVDEGHEYKNEGSAQGQAMGVLACLAKKVLLLTGTLMGGYASDLFFLLWRIMPHRMMELGYRCNERGSMASASMGFMREHGVLKDIVRIREGDNHRTSRGKRMVVSTVKGPGFGPLGIAQCILPFTVFLKLKDIGQKVLPPYSERYVEVDMDDDQRELYQNLEYSLSQELKRSLRLGDNSLLGVVLNVLLAWPDTCFREETVKHPRTKALLAFAPSVFDEEREAPKETWLKDYCIEQKSRGRKCLVYTSYTGKRDTCSRLKELLVAAGLRVAVLRATVPTEKREDWVAEQVDKGIDVLICNPELVKTGLDLLEFPSIVFMQTGYNVYTLMQAARRSWRIGQTEEVEVVFAGYAMSSQSRCLALMAEKIAVSQSTSGDIPESGLDSLNQRGDSVEVALARNLLAA